MNRINRIQTRLKTLFNPEHLEIIDESHLHKGHIGARDGKGHYRLNMISARFLKKTPIERHRMIFSALEEMMKTDIHALTINATPPIKLYNPEKED